MRFLFAVFCIVAAPMLAASAADQPKIKDPKAVADMMPPKPKLTVTAQILAPTPCYKTEGKHAGDEKTEPPGYILKVGLVSTSKPGTVCIQVLSYVPLSFVETPYSGTHDRVIIQHPDGETATVKIERLN